MNLRKFYQSLRILQPEVYAPMSFPNLLNFAEQQNLNGGVNTLLKTESIEQRVPILFFLYF